MGLDHFIPIKPFPHHELPGADEREAGRRGDWLGFSGWSISGPCRHHWPCAGIARWHRGDNGDRVVVVAVVPVKVEHGLGINDRGGDGLGTSEFSSLRQASPRPVSG